jgi:hypothetical protein
MRWIDELIDDDDELDDDLDGDGDDALDCETETRKG